MHKRRGKRVRESKLYYFSWCVANPTAA